MKTPGALSLALAVICGVIAATSMHYAMAATMLGIAFALVGIGFLDVATDPRRKPNPRTALLSPSEFGVICERGGYPREMWAGLYRRYRNESGRPPLAARDELERVADMRSTPYGRELLSRRHDG